MNGDILHTMRRNTPMMIRTTAYQWLTKNHLTRCKLSSEKNRFLSVASGPEGSTYNITIVSGLMLVVTLCITLCIFFTSLHLRKTSQYPRYWLHGVPALENMSGTSKGAWLSSKDETQGWLSPLSLQHSSQALVSLSSGPWLH